MLQPLIAWDASIIPNPANVCKSDAVHWLRTGGMRCTKETESLETVKAIVDMMHSHLYYARPRLSACGTLLCFHFGPQQRYFLVGSVQILPQLVYVLLELELQPPEKGTKMVPKAVGGKPAVSTVQQLLQDIVPNVDTILFQVWGYRVDRPSHSTTFVIHATDPL